MHGTTLAGLAGLAATILALPLGTARAAPRSTSVTLTLVDETDPAEVREATTIFINGQLAATFNLDAQHPRETKTVTIPAAQHYDYALCGRITIRRPDGQTETHVLDDGASLANVDGETLEALAGAEFTVFYLARRDPDAPSVPADLHRTNVCSVPVS